MELWINGDKHELGHLSPDKISVSQVVSQMGWAVDRVAVELNGDVIPKKEHNNTWVEHEDKLEVVTLIGGG